MIQQNSASLFYCVFPTNMNLSTRCRYFIDWAIQNSFPHNSFGTGMFLLNPTSFHVWIYPALI